MPEPTAMRRTRNLRSAVLGGLLLAGGATLAAAGSVPAGEPRVTPASGPSLIARLKTGVDWTAFGRAGESEAVHPATPERRAPGVWIEQGFRLSGADLFRLDCRGCHGPDGKGSRSGIPPLLGALDKPAEPTTGEPGGELRVRHRLVEGGRVMPTFGHLQGAEVDLVIGHLRALTAPGKESATTVEQSAMRVGEHIVKATCQICHDAVPGTWRQPADQLTVIPLSAMTDKLSVQEFVRKVRAGSPETGSPHGRMPRFDYLTPEELEAAYVYLTAYPPQDEKR